MRVVEKIACQYSPSCTSQAKYSASFALLAVWCGMLVDLCLVEDMHLVLLTLPDTCCSAPESRQTVYETASTTGHESMSGALSPSLASTKSPKFCSKHQTSWASSMYKNTDEGADDEMGSETGMGHRPGSAVWHTVQYLQKCHGKKDKILRA